MQATGYNQLRKTQRISTFYCSSQCCASGTCGDDDYPRKLELKKNQEHQGTQNKVPHYVISRLKIERSS